MPPTALEASAAQYALTGKSCLLQCPLLGDVRDLGGSLDPVHLRVREQVPYELPLCLGAMPASSRLRRQRHPDVPAVGGPGGLVLAPSHEAEPLITRHRNERATVVGEQPVFGPLAPEPAWILPAVPFMLPGGRWVARQPVQQWQVVLGHRPQVHVIVHGQTL